MKKILMTTTAIVMGLSAQAHAASFAERAAKSFASKGYTEIEVEEEHGRVTVHATRGGKDVETVYDASTGDVLSHDVRDSDGDESDEGDEFSDDESDDSSHDEGDEADDSSDEGDDDGGESDGGEGDGDGGEGDGGEGDD